MSEIKDGGPAFPVSTQRFEDGSINVHPEIGMTLRDYFAAKAMTEVYKACQTYSEIGVEAYKLADAMLRARSA